ncbi:MAG: sigma-70 family RNA polymerase sigma factor [Planctomycetota bacterium]
MRPPGESPIHALPEGKKLELLFCELLEELHTRARRSKERFAPAPTLQTGEVVNEAFLRIRQSGFTDWKDRDHFLMYASKVMRSFLVDQCRRRRVRDQILLMHSQDLDQICGEFEERCFDAEAIDLALSELERSHPKLAKAIELRFFAGLEMAEIARLVDMPLRTLERRWNAAKLLLRHWMKE